MTGMLVAILSLLFLGIVNIRNVPSQNDTTGIPNVPETMKTMVVGITSTTPHMSSRWILQYAETMKTMVNILEISNTTKYSPPEPALAQTCPAICPAVYPFQPVATTTLYRERVTNQNYLDLTHVPVPTMNVLQGFQGFHTKVLISYKPPEISNRGLIESATSLASVDLAPAHILLLSIYLFWFLINSGKTWMLILYLISIQLQWSLGYDSCLIRVYAITLFLNLATIFAVKMSFGRTRQRKTKRASCKRGK